MLKLKIILTKVRLKAKLYKAIKYAFYAVSGKSYFGFIIDTVTEFSGIFILFFF